MDLRSLISKIDDLESKNSIYEGSLSKQITKKIISESKEIKKLNKSSIAKALLEEFNLSEVANPYNPQSPEGKLFPLLSPADQAWLTKGGGRPAFANDRYMQSRMPNKGRPVQQAPVQQAPASVSNTSNAQTRPVSNTQPEILPEPQALQQPAQRASVPQSLQAIMTSNPNITDPNRINVGQEINLPGGGVYTVSRGDTLAGIAAGRYRGQPPQISQSAQEPPASGAQGIARRDAEAGQTQGGLLSTGDPESQTFVPSVNPQQNRSTNTPNTQGAFFRRFTSPEQVDQEIQRFSSQRDMNLPANQRIIRGLEARRAELQSQN